MNLGPIVLQIVLILLNAVFASAEIAVISMNETKLKALAEDGDVRAAKLARLTKQPARFLATIQVAITMAALLGSAFAAENFAGALVIWLLGLGVKIPEQVLKVVSLLLITLILAYFNIVFGELVPKRIAMKKADSLALALAGMLSLVSRAFAPLVWLLTASTNTVLKLFGINPEEEEEKVTEEEIRMLLMAGSKQGVIDTQETELIKNVFEFDDTSAEQICTHRVDVIALYTKDSMEVWEETIHNNRHVFYPVCGEDSDDIIGVLNTGKYFRLKERSREAVMGLAVEKGYFVPERMKASVLLQNMKKTRSYFAIVMDEYGGMSGIITIRALIEELVGDLDADTEKGSEDIVRIGENCWRIQGCAMSDDVELALGMSLTLGEYDTFGGYICGIIDRVPDDGEQFFCAADGLDIEVQTVVNHRIGETLVHKREQLESE